MDELNAAFEEMTEMLKNGEIMNADRLTKMFDAADEIKKAAMKPSLFSYDEYKLLNPRNKYLVWSAILLGDKKRFERAESILGESDFYFFSIQGLPRSKGGRMFPKEQLVSACINELLDLAPDQKFRNQLVKNVMPFLTKKAYRARFTKNKKKQFSLIVSFPEPKGPIEVAKLIIKTSDDPELVRSYEKLLQRHIALGSCGLFLQLKYYFLKWIKSEKRRGL